MDVSPPKKDMSLRIPMEDMGVSVVTTLVAIDIFLIKFPLSSTYAVSASGPIQTRIG